MKNNPCHKIKTIAIVALSLLAVNAAAAEYDVAAYVWPAYQGEPRWRELKIFAHSRRASATRQSLQCLLAPSSASQNDFP